MARKTPTLPATRYYARFSLSSRLQHLVMLLSFTALAITGLVQKYALSGASVFIVRLLGGIENVRSTHHVAATVLMLVTIYHIVDVGYRVFVLRSRMSMLPGPQDVKDAWRAFTHNLGFGKTRPQFGRYGFEEKAEYWALVWGTIVMGITGFMMWNPLATIQVVPGEFIPAAKAAHGAEAVLAVLAIIVWHMYGVHLRRFNKSMWTGNVTEEEMLHEHPLELADIKAGIAGQPPPPAAIRARQKIYYPVAGVLVALLLFAIYGFVRGEETAITTIPPQRESVPVFVPQTPTPLPPTPTPRPPPTALPTSEGSTAAAPELNWAQVEPIFAGKCTMCHGAALASGGLALDTYDGAMRGGQAGAVIVPGDADGSPLVGVQSAGGHPGQLAPEELSIVSTWIEAGAIE